MTEISWSEETYTIRELAMKDCFPTVVRVTEGYLPLDGNEAEAFSQGDLIKLDFKRKYQKVAARFLDAQSHVDLEGYMHPGGDLMLPLGYKGKVKIFHKQKSYKSVRELLNDFPRFVRVDKPIVVRRGSNKEKIEIGHCVIELDREIPGEGLVCRHENKDIVLKHGQEGRFSSVADDSQYTLMEVIERFPLPQNIQFIDVQFQATTTEDLDEAIENIKKFEGCLKLLRVVHQEVIVGHYKPLVDTTESKSGHFCRRAIALLPLDNKVVNEIEVQVPVYSESDDYEFLVAKNFSENVNMEEIEGSLYLEFSNIPRIHKFEKNYVVNAAEKPPPRPPKPGQGSGALPKRGHHRRYPPPPPKTYKFTSSSVADDSDAEEPPENYEEIADIHVSPPVKAKGGRQPKTAPKPTAVTRPNVHASKPHGDGTFKVNTPEKTEKLGNYLSKVPTAFKSGLKMVHDELFKRVKRTPSSASNKSTYLPPKKQLEKIEDSGSESEESYDYPDLKKMEFYEKTHQEPHNVSSEPFGTPSAPTSNAQQGKQIKNKPVAQVPPLSPTQDSDSDIVKPFHMLSVEELAQCFKQCSLHSLAERCKAEKIDGIFMSEIPSSEIQEILNVSLSRLQLKKVEMIKEGWRPKSNR